MKNIIKAQLYQLKKEKMIYIIFAIVLLLECTTMAGEMDLAGSAETGGGVYAARMGVYIMSIALMFGTMLTGLVCCSDFMDKTVNYEIMGGHERRNAFFGRAAVSLAMGTVGTMIISAVPVILCTMLYGWGDSIDFGSIFVRWLLSVFPVLRLICEMVFLSCLIRNAYAVMGIAFFVSLAGDSIVQLMGNGSIHFLALGSLKAVFDCSPWVTGALSGEKEIILYDSAVHAEAVVPAVAFSVVFGIFFLYLGYRIFAKDDLN